MKKETTILSLCALFLLADWFCFQQTLNFAHLLERFSFGLILSSEIATALMIFGVGYLMFRKIISNKSAKFSKLPEIFQPLRRIVLSVLTWRFARR